MTTSFYFYFTGRKIISAVLLALAISIKLIPGLFLLYFIIKSDYRQITKILLFTVFFFAIPLFLVPWNFQQVYYFQVIKETFPLTGKEIYYNQSLLAFLVRTLHSGSLAQILNYVLSVLIIMFSWVMGRGMSKERLLAAISCLPLLLSPLAWQHHFVFAVIPLLLLAFDIRNRKGTKGEWLLLLVAYFLLAIDIKNFVAVPKEFNFILSHDFYAVIMLWLFSLWKNKIWQIIGIFWIGMVFLGYMFMLLCRAGICF